MSWKNHIRTIVRAILSALAALATFGILWWMNETATWEIAVVSVIVGVGEWRWLNDRED